MVSGVCQLKPLSEQTKVFEPYGARFERGKVFIPNASGLIDLRDRGFGDLRAGKLQLSPYESFYLLEKGRIRVAWKDGEAQLRDLVDALSATRPDIWIKYLVYRDLRDRGYIVREHGRVDFEVHGKGALRRFISIIYEGGEASLKKLGDLLRHAQSEKKELVLAVVDRRTDIVYYTLTSLKV
jgi:tRNA-intron endonuclease